MLLLQPDNFQNYSLIDTGKGMKLEQFGNVVLSRPEPQAIWSAHCNEEFWHKKSHAVFTKSLSNDDLGQGEKGNWKKLCNFDEPWHVHYNLQGHGLKFALSLSSFKHVGLFPEQAGNWEFIYTAVKAMPKACRVLNLFAYTGASSLAACAAGAEVVHVDSVKQVITRANENMQLSGLKGIKWVAEDAAKFVQREARRGSLYHGIILDPPVYGRGPAGEKWFLQQHLLPLLEACKLILHRQNAFVLLNTYSLGFSAHIADNLLRTVFNPTSTECGELGIPDKAQRILPLSTFSRFVR